MDAAGQVTQFGDGLLGAAVGGDDQLQDPLQLGLPGPVDHAAEPLGGQPQLHGDGDHLRLRAVVQVPLDPAQPRGRVVHRPGPGLLQLTDPPRQRSKEQVVGDPELQRSHRYQQRAPPEAVRAQDDTEDEHPQASGQARATVGPGVAIRGAAAPEFS